MIFAIWMSCICERGDEGLEWRGGVRRFQTSYCDRSGLDKMEAWIWKPSWPWPELDNRFVGLALFRVRRDFDAERHSAVGRRVKPGDFIARGLGRDAEGEKASAAQRPAHNRGAAVVDDEIAQELQGEEQR